MSNSKVKKKRIDQILIDRCLVESKNKGQAMIMAGQVYSNGKLVKKSGELYWGDSNIIISKLDDNWVSRGALKLEPIIINQNINIKKKICLDIGSSTGGFTQVLLKHGAKKVYAVDVGYGQLHEKIRSNSKVISFERTNARYLSETTINEQFDIIVCDASFIGLKKVIENSLDLLKKKGKVVCLIKPQFEATKEEVKKGGVIKDTIIHTRVCKEIKNWFIYEKKFKVLNIVKSSIKGPKGNIEFFITAIK